MTIRRPLPVALSLALCCSLAAPVALAPAVAHAFCGFYVSGADAKLYNNATQVVLMRDGTRTVLSMQNNYQGPPQDFAMVVPVPVVLQEQDVKILPRDIFDRVDLLAAPRLVEYWEQDPCYQEPIYIDDVAMAPEAERESPISFSREKARDLGVKIEAQFTVGEYEIVILSAKDSLGLDTWLRINDYRIPAGAAEVLRPYVHGGMKFFVAKVNARKVRFENGQAMLSPLRFHYDARTFSLPVRLGLLNSNGAQDLIVHILSREVRYQVANYRNVAIPTNLEVNDATRERFGEFYAALFDRVLARNPGAVVTEYAWSAGSCDPCPNEPLSLAELATLGADVLPSYARALRGRVDSDLEWQVPGEFVLTRLHARYTREALGDDLVFQAAVPITGGREVSGPDGQLERGAIEASVNNFQARYIIRHRWVGPVECANPVFGRWGGPPPGVDGSSPAVARELAFVARDAPLEGFLSLEGDAAPSPGSSVLAKKTVRPPTPRRIGTPSAGGCASCQLPNAAPTGALAWIVGLTLLRRRRRASSRR